jgi:hypothetical protein
VNQYVLIDITSAVQAWLNGTQTNYGVALVGIGSVNANFDSKENTNMGHSPELDIVFINSGPQGPMGLQGPQGPAGPQGAQGLQGPIGLTGATTGRSGTARTNWTNRRNGCNRSPRRAGSDRTTRTHWPTGLSRNEWSWIQLP